MRGGTRRAPLVDVESCTSRMTPQGCSIPRQRPLSLPATQPVAAGGTWAARHAARRDRGGRHGELRTGAAPGGGFPIEATLPAKVEMT